MQAVLVMFRSDGDRRSFSLTRDITVVGRREDCDLRIPLGEVSRKHCRLVRDGDSLRLEDLGSSNGTYHNAQRVQEAILSPGDSIQVGPLVFVLQMDGVPADDELSPVQAQPLDEVSSGGMPGMPEDGPLQPTAQSEVGMQELPTIDERLDQLEPAESHEPLESLESVTTEDGFDILTDEALPEIEEDVDLGNEHIPLDDETNSSHH
jgi:pSer/pThr/pTyr-binding forkhead associated (FHA) protein